jgi:hypothetical protein
MFIEQYLYPFFNELARNDFPASLKKCERCEHFLEILLLLMQLERFSMESHLFHLWIVDKVDY